jgi:immune inhibitor A
MLFSSGSYPTGSMRGFFKEVTNSHIDIAGDIFGWYKIPQTYEYYINNKYGEGDYPRCAKRLVEDAVNAARSDVNFVDYDSDGDGQVDALRELKHT